MPLPFPRSAPDEPAESHPTACFSVHADADPGLMPRILEVFARRGLVPTRCHSSIVCGGVSLVIDLEMSGLTGAAATRIADEMRAVWGVGLVLASSKHLA